MIRDALIIVCALGLIAAVRIFATRGRRACDKFMRESAEIRRKVMTRP